MSFCRAILDRYHENKWTDLQSPLCGRIQGWTIGQTYVYAVPGPTVRYATESCTDRCSSQFKNNYLTKKCSGSEVGSYIRSIDCVYPSTLGLRVIKKREVCDMPMTMPGSVQRRDRDSRGGSLALSLSDSVSQIRRARAWCDSQIGGCVSQRVSI